MRTPVIEALEPKRYLATVRVDQNAPGVLQDGTSWDRAFISLQAAMAVTVPGDTIQIADGTYIPSTTGDRSASFVLRNGVSLFGGYAGFGASNPDLRDVAAYPTALSGNIGSPTSALDNSYHILRATFNSISSSITIDGFLMTAGRADATAVADTQGAAIYVERDNNPISISNCVFRENYASNGPGISTESSIDIQNCRFELNNARSYGGAIATTRSPTITGCDFLDNIAASGGALRVLGPGSPVVTNCRFIRNAATNSGGGEGGAVFMQDHQTLGGAGGQFRSCHFYANYAPGYGGAVRGAGGDTSFANCAFVGNFGFSGGAVYTTGVSGSLSVSHCTIVENTSMTAGGGINAPRGVSVGSSIIRDNTSPSEPQMFAQAPARYSNIQGGHAGDGNIDADPDFVRAPSPGPDNVWITPDDDFGDLRPSPASPVVDAAAAASTTMSTDLSGGPRFIDIPTTPNTGWGTSLFTDMGAYEAAPTLVARAGGPYAAFPDQVLQLSGRGASAAAGALTFAWEWTGDGLFDDANGAAPVFPTNKPAGTLVAVQLRITDGNGISAMSETTVRIVPRIASVDARANGSNDGTSWSNAFSSLVAALDRTIPGQTIRLAEGTYFPDTSRRAVAFKLGSGITLAGGYAGLGASNPDERDPSQYTSILSGELGAPGREDNSYQVVDASEADGTSILDGLTITRGNANDSLRLQFFRGGGVYCGGARPQIRDCTFLDNFAVEGGAIANANSSQTTIVRCTFLNNTADRGGAIVNAYSTAVLIEDCVFQGNQANVGARFGGGIYNLYAGSTIRRSAFTSNTAGSGAGIHNNASSPAISDCTFTNNTSTSGSGIYSNNFSLIVVTNCLFERNTGVAVVNAGTGERTYRFCTFVQNTGSSGAAIRNDSTAFGRVDCCTFIGNVASSSGGAILNSAQMSITNCAFVGNRANRGGAVFTTSSASTFTIFNSTFASNLATTDGGAIALQNSGSLNAANCIFYGNTAPAAPNILAGGTVSIWYSSIDGYSGNGNVNVNPAFIRDPSPGNDGIWGTPDDDYGNVRLAAESPCIDAGSNGSSNGSVHIDLEANPRRVDIPGVRDPGAVIDMGAYERAISPIASNLLFNPAATQPTVRIVLSNAVDTATIDLADLELRVVAEDGSLGATVLPQTWAYEPATRTIVFQLEKALQDANFRANVITGGILDTYGQSANALSGDFFFLRGDANQDRAVGLSDFALLANSFNMVGTYGQGDFDYSGRIDVSDFAILANKFNYTLAPPAAFARAMNFRFSDELVERNHSELEQLISDAE